MQSKFIAAALLPAFVMLSTSLDGARRRSRYTPPATEAVDTSARIMTGRFAYSETQTIGSPGPKHDLTIPLSEWADFRYPCDGKLISNYGMRSGRMHAGVDIKAQPLDTVRAVGAGVVRMAKEYYGYGKMALISHDNGLETLYGHNAALLVAPNQQVAGGEAIALAGRTGRATTEHCHFEVRVDGKYFDPNLLLDCANRTLRDDTLRIKYAAGRIVASRGAAASSTLPAESGATSHTVRHGDTLYSLARRYGTSVGELCRLNGITPQTTLHIGRKLRVGD